MTKGSLNATYGGVQPIKKAALGAGGADDPSARNDEQTHEVGPIVAIEDPLILAGRQEWNLPVPFLLVRRRRATFGHGRRRGDR